MLVYCPTCHRVLNIAQVQPEQDIIVLTPAGQAFVARATSTPQEGTTDDITQTLNEIQGDEAPYWP